MSRAKRFAQFVLILAVIGIALSALSLYNHYGKEETGYCSFDETFNCDLVNRSIYSSIGGVPVALIGVLGYGTIIVLSRIATRSRRNAALLLVSSICGLAFAGYLTYVEAMVLGVWCILCVGSQLIILTITVLAILIFIAARSLEAAFPNGATGRG